MLNDRMLNRDLAMLCERVNQASPYLPGGRWLLFTMPPTRCILAAQAQAKYRESLLMSEMVSFPTSKNTPPATHFLGSPPQRAVEQRKQERRARRVALYEEIRTLRMGGHSYQTIADTLGVCPRTVRRFVIAENYPDLNPWPRRGSIPDPYKPYLLQQIQAEHHQTASQLYS